VLSVVASVEEAKPVYSWLQDDGSIIVSFELPAGAVKADVEFELSAGSLMVGLKGSGVLLSGDLCGKVDVDGSSWIISDNKVYVCRHEYQCDFCLQRRCFSAVTLLFEQLEGVHPVCKNSAAQIPKVHFW